MTYAYRRVAASLSFGFIVAATMSSAGAQTTTTTTDQPKAIGTSQQTADEANRKAIESGKKATFVRTGPSAADKAKDVASSAKDKTGDAAVTAGDRTADTATTTTTTRTARKAHKAAAKTTQETTNP